MKKNNSNCELYYIIDNSLIDNENTYILFNITNKNYL